MYCSIFILCVFGNVHRFSSDEYYKESLSARLSLRLASTPPNLPQQSDRNHLQDALVLRLRTQFDSWKHTHRNCRATDATIHQPPKHVYTVYTNKQSVARKFYLWKCTLMQHVHWAKSHRVARQSSTTEHAYTQGPFNAAIPLCKVTSRDGKKTKHKSALQPESPGRSSTERKRAMNLQNTKAREVKKTTLVEITLTQWLSHCEQQVDHENAPATPWCSIFTTQRLTELQENMKRRDVEGCVRLRCCEV